MNSKQTLGSFWPALLAALSFSACDSAESDPNAGFKLGQDIVDGTPQPVPTTRPDPVPTTTPTAGPAIGESCRSSDPGHLCLALKYVVYKDLNSRPVVSDAEVIANIAEINQVWAQCKIGFEIEKYLPVDPGVEDLLFNTSSSGELTRIRRSYEDDQTLLVVSTGTWSGSLGYGSANAWTTLPGSGDYGVVMEEPVANYPNIIAHELGHYLNLDHYGSSTNVMSAIIYTGSTGLVSGQCDEARSAIQYYWQKMLR